jgi:hypothetical protein
MRKRACFILSLVLAQLAFQSLFYFSPFLSPSAPLYLISLSHTANFGEDQSLWARVLNPSQVANLMGPIDALSPRGARFHE